MNILNVFNTLTLKQIFWKTKTFFKKQEYRFYFKALGLKMRDFHTKLPYQKPMSRQIAWWLQNAKWTFYKERSFTSFETTLFFWKFCFNLRTSYKELIFCTNNPNSHICTFCKRWSFIWRCFSPVSIFKVLLNWNKKNDKRFNNRGYSEASVIDSEYIKMTELQDFY